MSCQKVLKFISPLLDDRLAGGERAMVQQHLAACRECSARLKELTATRQAMSSVPPAAPPSLLISRLRVMASHDRERRLAFRSLGSAMRYFGDRLRLAADNLMRPFAIPFAGGFMSALVLFSMLVPSLNFAHNFRNDVRLDNIYTDPTVIELAPFALNEDVVIELTIDEKGQVLDYALPHGKVTVEQANNIANLMLFTSFTPATWFGQPTSGKITVTLVRTRVVVRG